MSGRDLSDEERRAWRAVTRHVRPLPGRPLKRGAKGAETESRNADTAMTPDRPNSRSKAAPRPQNLQNEKRVRRGRQVISARLDLHGHTQQSAWEVLPRFLKQHQSLGADCVIVITGKGRDGEGVLRRNFLMWIEMPEAASLVRGFAQAHPKHGGSGAWYVYLRKPRGD